MNDSAEENTEYITTAVLNLDEEDHWTAVKKAADGPAELEGYVRGLFASALPGSWYRQTDDQMSSADYASVAWEEVAEALLS